MCCLNIPDTLVEPGTPTAGDVDSTGSTGLWLGVILCPCVRMAPSSVDRWGKCLVAHILLPQVPPLPQHARLAPCTVGSANAPAIMGPLQSSAGHTPKAADFSRQTSDEDWHIVASLWEEPTALRQRGDGLGCHEEDPDL